MSSSFKKILPFLAIALIFAGGYLLSEFTGGMFGSGVAIENVSAKAQEVQSRLNFLTTVSGFETTIRDVRLDGYTRITKTPEPEESGRNNPFIR
ncbi:hypothetical protein A3C89_01435 [Candidatus Kaiserbacteria bacterium RIFCSPHIGHO2_02_FULL_50_50]|uniref:Uncharacterized protein n=1 Tax=Candidatus Kaiserbacteria bacterium RIFCSPHIGHO2_02_FULL_50_50 TaxID=1798492 RepID=A0A1F6DC86_9BACT|nr:MAG: hypothetical protein A3C89_01435 [Candidatus Kaiserbacteria bacterium RIFCSPHIGHO2_02_FULL_50_50]OGG89305.1 MAG: hypothetical protein A3G62_01510 [Candidatus Kaiserbacteria bacterium RIFCSPLOWO2_12_FULL_50_10]